MMLLLALGGRGQPRVPQGERGSSAVHPGPLQVRSPDSGPGTADSWLCVQYKHSEGLFV